MKTKQIILASRPKGLPVLENFNTKDFELAETKDNEVLLEAIYFSVDPYMRGRMNDAKSYAPPFEIGKPIRGGVIAKVINYKTCKDLKKAIADACPKAVDIYYDNVGGEISDAVISNINFNARIVLCG